MEFAVVTAALTGLIVGLAALWHGFEGGMVVRHALAAASHHLAGVPVPFLADIFRY